MAAEIGTAAVSIPTEVASVAATVLGIATEVDRAALIALDVAEIIIKITTTTCITITTTATTIRHAYSLETAGRLSRRALLFSSCSGSGVIKTDSCAAIGIRTGVATLGERSGQALLESRDGQGRGRRGRIGISGWNI